MDKYKWDQILGNPYSQSPRHEMIEGTYTRTCNRGLKGGAKHDVKYIFVEYDKAYLIEWIARKVILPLGIADGRLKFNELQSIISESIKRAKQIHADSIQSSPQKERPIDS